MDNDIKVKGSVLIIKLAGEIDHHSSGDLRDKIDKAYERFACKQIIFDFTQVTFMDSSGIGMVIGRYKNAEKQGGAVYITGMNDEIKRIYNISGLSKIVKNYATVEEAERQIG